MIRLIHLFFFCFSLSALQANDHPYERFVGIGNCCAARTQINAHLEKRFGMDQSQFGGGQLFDWVVIRDYNKFALALERNLSDFFERADLFLDNRPDYPWVENTKYKLIWNHLFTRKADQSIALNIFDLEYDLKKQKINYLSEKFINLKNYRTLYILTFPFEEPNLLQAKEPNKKTIIRVRNALLKLRGNDNFSLLFCPLIPKFKSFENIIVIRNNNGQELPNVGNYTLWDQILSQFPFSLDKAEFDLNPLEQSKFN